MVESVAAVGTGVTRSRNYWRRYLPRRGKGSKWDRGRKSITQCKPTVSRTATTELDLRDVTKVMERLGIAFEEACAHVRMFGASVGAVEKAARKLRENASIAQTVERSVEAREAGVRLPVEAPAWQTAEEKAWAHARNYGMSPKTFGEMYDSGGSRGISKSRSTRSAEEGKEAGEADPSRAEHERVSLRSERLRDTRGSAWYDA